MPHFLEDQMALEALFGAGIGVAVKGIVLLLVAGGLTLLMRRASAAAKHSVWTAALVALLVMPFLSSQTPSISIPVPGWAASAPTVGASQPVEITDRMPVRLLQAPVESAPAPRDDASTAIAPAAGAEPAAEAGACEGVTPGATAPSAPDATTQHAQPGVDHAATTNLMNVRNSDPASAAKSPWFVRVAWIWLAGVVLVAGWFALQHASVRWLEQQAQPIAADETRRMIAPLAASIGLRRNVRVLEGSAATMPMTWGVWRPVVLLPAGAAQWSPERLRDVLLHELAHIKRADLLTQALAQLACTLHWFNPLVWIAARRMHVEREHACDDYVLGTGTRPSEYASNLLEVARSLRRSPATSMAAIAMAGRSTLSERLLAVLDDTRPRGWRGRGRLMATGVALIACVALLASIELLPGAQAAPPERRGPRVRVAPRAFIPDAAAPVVVPVPPVSPRVAIVPEAALAPEVFAVPTPLPGKALAILDAEDLAAIEALRADLEIEWQKLEGDENASYAVLQLEREQAERLLDALRAREEAALDAAHEMAQAPTPTPAPPGWGGWNWRSSTPTPMAILDDHGYSSRTESDGEFTASHWNGSLTLDWNDDGTRMRLKSRGEIEFNDDMTDVVSISRRGYLDIESDEGGKEHRVRLRGERDGTITRTWWVAGDEKPWDADAAKWLAETLPEMLSETGMGAEKRVRKLLDTSGVDGVLTEIAGIRSDHAQRLYFSELQAQADLTDSQLGKVFETAAKSIDSDFELASLLATSAEHNDLNAAACTAYAKASETIGSDFEQRRALAALVEHQPLEPAALGEVFRAAASIGSDFELASLLVQVVDRQKISESNATVLLDALEIIGSDFEQRRVLKALAESRDLPPALLTGMLRTAERNLGSDFEMAEFLIVLGREHKLDGEALAAYLEALESVDSDFEYRRVASTLAKRANVSDAGMAKLVRDAGISIGSDFELAQFMTQVAKSYDVKGDLRDAYLEASESIGSEHENRRVLAALVETEKGAR
jgi:beta-lactamase regulating signal transducer with metallopeptidase domain